MTVVDLNTEKRIKAANDNANAAMWNVRDMLVDAIRRIDTGEISPAGAVIVWLDRDEDGTQVNATVAAVTLIEAVYMLASIKQDMLNG